MSLEGHVYKKQFSIYTAFHRHNDWSVDDRRWYQLVFDVSVMMEEWRYNNLIRIVSYGTVMVRTFANFIRTWITFLYHPVS